MADIRQYLLSVIVASVISAIALNLIDRRNTHHAVLRLLTGVFLSITVIAPLTDITLSNLTEYFETVEYDGDHVAGQGIEAASDLRKTSISDQLEAYILDKAYSLGVTADVEVELSDDDSFSVARVRIHGVVSPYTKTKIQETICRDLGLTEDKLIWE